MKINSKKGVIEAQFNWIFIIVVGGIILIFFISLVSNQKKTSDLTTSSELLNHLDSIVKGASISAGTVYDISMPLSQALSNDCESQALTFANSKIQGIDVARTVLFAPREMIGTKIFTYSLYWQEPYAITPFLYMTTDSVLFFVVNSSKLDTIYSELPVNELDGEEDEQGNVISVLKYGINQATLSQVIEAPNDHYTHIKIISTQSSLPNNFNQKTKARIILYTVPEPTDEEYNGYFTINITEYRKGEQYGDIQEVHVLGFPSLLGAIFSDSVEEYECSMTKALTKYKIIATLQQEKSNELNRYVTNSDGFYSAICNSYYGTTEHNHIVGTVQNILDGVSNVGVLDLSDLSSVQSSVESLRAYNKRLGDRSCPVPY